MVGACSADPDTVGDACDIDEGAEACPEGLVCANRDGDDICLYAPGTPCDPTLEEDYCHEGACVDDDMGGESLRT